MIKQEYQRLLSMIESCMDLKRFNLEEILKEAVIFFEVLRKEFTAASKEEREEMMQMMTHLHSKLQEVSTKAAQQAGMTEEELNAFAENPSNFTPDQWRTIQETKGKLYDSARKFSSSIDQERREKGIESDQPEAVRKPSSKGKRTRRQDWTKS